MHAPQQKEKVIIIIIINIILNNDDNDDDYYYFLLLLLLLLYYCYVSNIEYTIKDQYFRDNTLKAVLIYTYFLGT